MLLLLVFLLLGRPECSLLKPKCKLLWHGSVRNTFGSELFSIRDDLLEPFTEKVCNQKLIFSENT